MTYEEQMIIVSMLAVYEDFDSIKEKMLEKTGKTITTHQIEHYVRYPAWQPKIEKIREEFEAKIVDEPLSSKRIRIRELSKAYDKLKDKNKIRDSVWVLSNIREEIEGKGSGQTSITQYNQYNGLSDEDLRKVIDENSRFLNVIEERKKQLTIEVSPEEGSNGA